MVDKQSTANSEDESSFEKAVEEVEDLTNAQRLERENKKPDSVGSCLVPDCDRTPAVRGMCDPCYMVARKAVADSKTTWETLEGMGVALPSSRAEASPMTKFLKSLDEDSSEG